MYLLHCTNNICDGVTHRRRRESTEDCKHFRIDFSLRISLICDESTDAFRCSLLLANDKFYSWFLQLDFRVCMAIQCPPIFAFLTVSSEYIYLLENAAIYCMYIVYKVCWLIENQPQRCDFIQAVTSLCAAHSEIFNAANY